MGTNELAIDTNNSSVPTHVCLVQQSVSPNAVFSTLTKYNFNNKFGRTKRSLRKLSCRLPSCLIFCYTLLWKSSLFIFSQISCQIQWGHCVGHVPMLGLHWTFNLEIWEQAGIFRYMLLAWVLWQGLATTSSVHCAGGRRPATVTLKLRGTKLHLVSVGLMW